MKHRWIVIVAIVVIIGTILIVHAMPTRTVPQAPTGLRVTAVE